tara:strand:- start:3343 stop:3609 length:267 start_codon:yes stop_codon:yes gene_type:complete
MGIVKKLIAELRTEIGDEEYLLLSHNTDEEIDEMSELYSKEEIIKQKYDREKHKGKIDGLKKAVYILGTYAKNNSYHSQTSLNRHNKE